MAITAWAANGLQELDLPVGERPYLGPPDADRPDGLGPAEQRNIEHCPEAVGPRKDTALGVFVNLGLQIGDVDRPPVEHRTSRGRSPQRKRTDRSRGDRALVSDEAEFVAIDLEDRGIEGVAQTGGAPQHRREHGLDVGRELEMTRRISAVAVCCSRASLRAPVISAYDEALARHSVGR